MFKKTGILLTVLALSTNCFAVADYYPIPCTAANECQAGTQARTAFAGDTYYICPSRQLIYYIDSVIAVINADAQAGKVPNINDVTGEPEPIDDEVATMNAHFGMQDNRKDAHVASFDEALSNCAKGRFKEKVVVLNNPKDESLIWVKDEKTQETFWMPKRLLFVK